MLASHILEAAHELADAALNPTGYASNAGESDRRSVLRDDLERYLVVTVEAFLTTHSQKV